MRSRQKKKMKWIRNVLWEVPYFSFEHPGVWQQFGDTDWSWRKGWVFIWVFLAGLLHTLRTNTPLYGHCWGMFWITGKRKKKQRTNTEQSWLAGILFSWPDLIGHFQKKSLVLAMTTTKLTKSIKNLRSMCLIASSRKPEAPVVCVDGAGEYSQHVNHEIKHTLRIQAPQRKRSSLTCGWRWSI